MPHYLSGIAGSRRLLSHAVIRPKYSGWMDEVEHAINVLKPDSWKGYSVGSPGAPYPACAPSARPSPGLAEDTRRPGFSMSERIASGARRPRYSGRRASQPV